MSAAAEAALGRRLGLPEAALGLLAEALTHPSFAHEAAEGRPGQHYERLEFLGDAAINLVAAELCCQRLPAAGEGELSRRRAALVCRQSLAELAEVLGLPELVRRGPSAGAGPPSPRVRAAVLEAVLGVAFTVGGLAAVARALGDALAVRLEAGLGEVAADAKSRLQEACHRQQQPPPAYRVEAATGPAHARHFRCAVWLGPRRVAVGEGSRLKAAEQACAVRALAVLGDGAEGVTG